MEINYKLIFESLPTEVMIYDAKDPDYKMLATTKAHLKTLGRNEEDIVGRNVFDVFVDVSGNKEKVEAAIKCAIQTKKHCRPELMRYDIPNHVPGHFDKKYWALDYSPAIDENGEVVYVIETSTDITQLVELGLKID